MKILKYLKKHRFLEKNFFRKTSKILMFLNLKLKKIFFQKNVQNFNVFKFEIKKKFFSKKRPKF